MRSLQAGGLYIQVVFRAGLTVTATCVFDIDCSVKFKFSATMAKIETSKLPQPTSWGLHGEQVEIKNKNGCQNL